MKGVSIFFFVFFLMVHPAFVQPVGVRTLQELEQGFVIVSPMAGTWANKQPLVLEVPESYEVFYSFSGSHPMESGFAYDGPVILDAEGNVSLRIALVFPHGDALVYTIDYSVKPAQDGAELNLDVNFARPLVSYSIGQKITIPTGFSYKLGNSKGFLPGEQILSLEGGTFPKRFLPCHVTDGIHSWRFVISPTGVAAGDRRDGMADKKDLVAEKQAATTAVSRGAVKVEYYFVSGFQEAGLDAVSQEPSLDPSQPPFLLSNWDMLTFTRDKLIYSIDNGIWQYASGSVMLDRSVGHTIFWQSVIYERENPIYSYYLPPKPTGQLHFLGKDAVTIELGEEFTIVPTGSSQKPVPSLCIDAFYGEDLAINFPVDIYYKDLYQGSSEVVVSIDKCPPAAPVIEASSRLFYNRDKVSLSLSQPEGADIFYSLEILAAEEAWFKDIALELSRQVSVPEPGEVSFLSYTGSPLQLDPHLGYARLFSVRAYSQDRRGNRSPVVDYHAIIDSINYYVSVEPSVDSLVGASSDLLADGSFARPFTSIQQALRQTVSMDFVRIHVKGMVPVEEEVSISSNCEILGNGLNCGFVMRAGGKIGVKDAHVVIKDCVLEQQATSQEQLQEAVGQPALFIFGGNLSLIGCQVLGDYVSTKTIISSENLIFAVDSNVYIVDSDITLRTGSYGALLSGLRSNVIVTGGRFTVVAPTAVVFSLFAGCFQISGSQCRVFGNLGRVAELTGVGFSLIGNEFHGVFKGRAAATDKLVPVWKDIHCQQIESRDNIISGFSGS